MLNCAQAAELLLEKAKGKEKCSMDVWGDATFTLKYGYERVAETLKLFGALPCPQEIIEEYKLNAT